MAAHEVSEGREERSTQAKDDIKWAAALMLLVVVAVSSFTLGQWWEEPRGGEELSPWVDEFGRERQGLTGELFETWVVPFELLSVLLLAALVAAIVLAIREPDVEEPEEGA